MKIFAEIGYSNLKVIIDSNKDAMLFPITLPKLKEFMSNFNFDEDQLFILNNNKNFQDYLISFKQDKNYFLFDKKVNSLDINVSPDININELGNDLYFLVYYLSQLERQNAILISHGSCLVTIVKKSGVVVSASINLGLSTSLEVMQEKYHLTTDGNFFNGNGTNTDKAISLGEFLIFKGLIDATTKHFNVSNNQLILCGNGLSPIWLEQFKTATNYDFINQPFLVLETFRTWCKNILLK